MSACVLLLAGCGGSGKVEISSPDVTAAERTACERFLAALPAELAGQKSRTVTPAGALGAAWGDPAFTVTCGVAVPQGFDRLAGCTQVNGVGWFVPEDQISDQGKDVVMTTIDRKPNIEVDVPSEYRPPDATMVDLAPSIKQHTEVVSPCE